MSTSSFKDPNATPFESLCRFMDKVAAYKLNKKKELFEQLIRQVPNAKDLFPILRLIFPESDASRAVYNLKEHSIGRIFADLLFVPPQEKDRLLNWRDPKLQANHNCIVGDFPSVLLSVIEPRLSTIPTTKMSVSDVNSFLSDLYKSGDNEDRKRLFRDLISKSRPMELKWMIRIILKDLKLGLSIESILRHLHPHAISIYHISSSLEDVLSGISTSNPTNLGIFFQPIKPMLSERVNPSSISEKFADMGPIYLEPKLDGERMLVHVSKSSNRVAVLSRNGVNFTDKYGAQNLTSLLLTSFKGEGAVFDGEMVSWDPLNKRIHAFGKNRHFSNKSSPNTDSEDEDLPGGHIQYVVFDLLYYIDLDLNEHDLRETVLSDRRELLERILIPHPHRIELIPFQAVVAEPDLISTYLGNALNERDEGIIIKRQNSTYRLNQRNGSGWFKIKSDYDDLYSDTLDLVVLGGYFGEAEYESENPLSQVSSFLVGVVDGKEGFKTVTKVGTGLTNNQIVFIRNRLRNSIVVDPKWLGDWSPSKGNKPDVYISPYINPVVLEIRAGEITPTNEFSSKYQLRFPRVVKPRTDKDWSDATSLNELKEIASVNVNKERIFIQKIQPGRPFGGNSGKSEVAPKKAKPALSVIKPHLES